MNQTEILTRSPKYLARDSTHSATDQRWSNPTDRHRINIRIDTPQFWRFYKHLDMQSLSFKCFLYVLSLSLRLFGFWFIMSSQIYSLTVVSLHLLILILMYMNMHFMKINVCWIQVDPNNRNFLHQSIYIVNQILKTDEANCQCSEKEVLLQNITHIKIYYNDRCSNNFTNILTQETPSYLQNMFQTKQSQFNTHAFTTSQLI